MYTKLETHREVKLSRRQKTTLNVCLQYTTSERELPTVYSELRSFKHLLEGHTFVHFDRSDALTCRQFR